MAAVLLIAAAGVSVVPRHAPAADPGCHQPAPQNVVTAGHEDCGHCAQASCLSMPGCAQAAVALIATPPAGPAAFPQHAAAEPEARVVQDLASRGPPTPPPNS
jgi:hypothetical protein